MRACSVCKDESEVTLGWDDCFNASDSYIQHSIPVTNSSSDKCLPLQLASSIDLSVSVRRNGHARTTKKNNSNWKSAAMKTF